MAEFALLLLRSRLHTLGDGIFMTAYTTRMKSRFVEGRLTLFRFDFFVFGLWFMAFVARFDRGLGFLDLVVTRLALGDLQIGVLLMSKGHDTQPGFEFYDRFVGWNREFRSHRTTKKR